MDPSRERIPIDQSTLTDGEIEEGVGCLLELKGQKTKGRFYGHTRSVADYTSADRYRPPKPATVEIAALYYASYLFYANWQHAGAVVLYDEASGKNNSKRAVEKAYKSYREWFKQVVRMGLKQARERKLDPLEGSGIRWW